MANLRRPTDAPRKAKPVFSSIVAREPIDSIEAAALSAHPNLEAYPIGDYANLDWLRFYRYLYATGRMDEWMKN